MLFQTIAGVFIPKDIFHLWNDQVANAGWFDAGYGYRKEIKIDHTKVAGDLTNFPVLISLTDVALKTTANGGKVTSTSGYDIIFSNASGSQKLDHEMEKYDGSTGEIVMWVKVPALSASTDTSIYIYYGNGSITTSQENKTGVWDDGGANNFKMVQHMNQTGTGAAGDYKDSTQYANNSTNIAGQPTVSTSGKIGNAESFDGTSQYVNVGNQNSSISSPITISAWIKAVSIPDFGAIMDNYGGATKYWALYLAYGKARFQWRDASGLLLSIDSNAAYTTGQWIYVTAKRGDGKFSLSVNGVKQTAEANDTLGDISSNYDIGIGKQLAGTAYAFPGAIDEVRISNTARSAQWISTEYNNQNNPTEFSSLGIEEVSSPVSLSSFGYRKAITIDHTKVAGNLTNFPILINLPADASLQAHAQSDNDDILFTSSSIVWNTGTVNDKLAHEVESYNSTTGSLTAWVKIPSLSSTVDTTIYMYYGNNAVTSQQNNTIVWDASTKMVQHMNQTGTGQVGDYKDSTQYQNNSVNTTGQPTAGIGQIGQAEGFDGATQYVGVGGKENLFLKNSGTISTWIYPTALASSGYNVIYTSEGSADVNKTPYLRLESGVLRAYLGNGTSTQAINSSLVPALNKWHYVILSWDGINVQMYMDNQIYTTSQTVTVQFTGTPYNIGRYITGAERTFQGSLDEVRISSAARSAEWISTEYNNQSKPTEFSSLGIEEVFSPASLSSFGYRKAITIDHTKVAGNLANFPVLINLPTDASLQAHAQADNDDILFTSSSVVWNTGTVNDKLASEIESYNSSNGSLTVWVKIPNLSSTTDTVIYMYYGNAAVTSQQNKTVVWGGNAKAVWHLKETGTGTSGNYKDSTIYQNNSTNAANQPTVMTGQIGSGESFNGTSQYISHPQIYFADAQAYSYSVWVKWSGSDPTTFVLPFGKTNDVFNTIYFTLSGGAKTFGYRSNGANPTAISESNTTALFNGNWHLVSWSVATSKNVTFYVDGVQNGSSISMASTEFYYDSFASGYSPSQYLWNGSLDEVRISSAARSAEWISTEYNNQSKPTEFSSLGIEEVSSPAALSSFGYRKAITIDHTKVAGNLTNFPVLINLPTDASLQAHAQADNDDILFTSSGVAWNTGTVNDKLAHEVESYNNTDGSLQAWVKIPNLSSITDTVIYMYYGNGSITSQQNKTAVWDGNTKMVQHMNQDPGGTAPQMIDSTTYHNNGASGGSMTSSGMVPGQVDGAIGFDGTNDYINVGSSSSLNIGGAITVDAWVKLASASAQRNVLASTGYFLVFLNSGNTLVPTAYAYGVTGGDSLSFSNAVSLNNWYHLVFTYNSAGGSNNLKTYINGTLTNQGTRTGLINTLANPVIIGAHYSGGANFFNGSLDEVRISSAARSAEWISTEYNNQSKPTEFSSLGIEEVFSPASLSSFGYRKAITIDHTKVAGNLANFPVLINLPTDASFQAHAQNDADDILFTSSSTAWNTGTVNDKLAHEVESYNSTNGSLQAWVKIPNLSSTTDTVIFMYYGHGSVTSQQNKTAVWDGSAKMVQHMNQDPGGTAPQMIDSTQYGNNGTSGGSMTVANSVAGQVDGGTSFNGVNDRISINDPILGSTKMTTCFWAKKTAYAQFQGMIADYDNVDGKRNFFFYESPENTIDFYIGDGTSTDYITKSGFTAGIWHYVCGVFIGNSTLSVYVDGVSASKTTTRSNIGSAPSGNSFIGAYRTTYFFNGNLDEVRISSAARSAEWISTEYNNQSNPSSFYGLSAEQVYRIEITGSAAQTAGVEQTITLTARNVSGSVMTDFNGDKTLALSGANTAPSGTAPSCADKNGTAVAFGSPLTLAFTNGVATCNLKLYKAETASIAASGINSTSTNLAVTVSPATLNNFYVDAPASENSGQTFAATITSRDGWNNTTRTVSGSAAITASSGTVSPASLSSGNFTDDGVWSGNVTVSGIVERPSVVLAATNGSSSGSDSISILGIPNNPQNASAARNNDYSMTLTWQDASTVETGYLIERKVNNGSGFGSYVQIGSVAENISSFTDDNASNPGNTPIPDRSYQYRVRAMNSIGNSGYGEDAAVHYTTPNTPSNVFSSRLNDNSFQVSYTDNAAVTNTHRIERCSNANCGTSFETSLGNSASSPQTDSVSIYPDSRYRWQARAEAPGISSNYEVSNFEYTTPAIPVIQNSVYVSNSQINVNWTDTSSYEDGFRIEISIDSGAWQEVTPGTNTVGANITSYAYASSGDHNYKFRVRSHIGATVHNGELFSAYSGESAVVYTASASPIIGAPLVNSSTSITWNWTDTSAFEENFHLHFIAGSGTDVNDISANAASYTSTGLIPNTKYGVHVHSYRADAGESDPSAASAEVYTLANVPADLILHRDSQYQLTASWNNNQNPQGTQYYIENMNTGKNSGWITNAFWTSNNLNCGTKYSFRVKAKNESGIETAFLGIVDAMTEDCSPGLPSAYANAPKSPQKTADNPAGELKIAINKDEKYTASPIVTLSLFAGSDTTRMAISNSTDFKDALLVPYQKEIRWNLDSSTDGMRTVYAKFYTKYGIPSQLVSDSIVLDTTAPAFSIADPKDKYYLGDNVSIFGKTETGARIIYNLDSRSLGAVDAADGIFTVDLGALSEGGHTLKLFAQDALGNASDVKVLTFSVEKTPLPASPIPVPSVPAKPSAPASPVPAPANPVPPTPTSPAAPSQTPTSPNQPSQPESPSPATPLIPSPGVSTPPVSQETPVSMSGEWNLLKIKPFPSGISTQDIGMIVEKFPEFKEMFKSLGINDFTDARQLQNASLMIPGISQVVGLNPTGLYSNLPAVTTPVAELSASLKKEIPQNILFIRTTDSNMDINSDLTFENGVPNQKASLLPGKSLELVLRPDGETDSVKGYLTYKGKQASLQKNALEKISMLIPPVHAQEDTEEKLVLLEFDYNDDDKDGIWTANISTPQVAGEYELITVLNYKDVKIGSKTIRMITVIDPEGYVYRKDIDNIEARIPNATVSLHWFNSETKKYELWDAGKYQQKNPQVTDNRGSYSFLVPSGSYYLQVEADGYQSYQGKPFDVTAGNGVHANIELFPVLDWRDQLTWERVVIAIFGIALCCNFYWDRKARKRIKVRNP